MAENENRIFRKETLDRISSPEQLTDYLKVTSPGIWLVLISVITLLIGLGVWASIGVIKTTPDAHVIIKDHVASVVLLEPDSLEQGMTLIISEQEYVIASVMTDEYGREVGIAEVALPDGLYDAKVVTETIHPIQFLFEKL